MLDELIHYLLHYYLLIAGLCEAVFNCLQQTVELLLMSASMPTCDNAVKKIIYEASSPDTVLHRLTRACISIGQAAIKALVLTTVFVEFINRCRI